MTETKKTGGAGRPTRLTAEGIAALEPRRTPRREAQVGLFVIAGLLAVLIILFQLTDPGMFRGRYEVTALVDDAQGIRRGDAVQMQGVSIGRVRGFELADEGVLLSLELQGRYRVPADSRAELTQGGLLGDMVVAITPGDAERTLEEGGVLQVERTGEGIMSVAGSIAERADSVVGRAGQLLSESTLASTAAAARDLQILMAEMAALAVEQRRQIGELTSSLQRSAEGLEASATRPELARAIARTDTLTLRLDAASGSLQQASASLAALTSRVESGEGTLGRLTADDELYRNLNEAVASLRALTTDIRENPRRYLDVSIF